MRSIKYFLMLSLLFLFLNPVLIVSQEKKDDYNALAEKKWSVVFEIGTFFNNYMGNSYTSFSLSGKYNLNKNNGLRLSLGTSGYTKREHAKNTYFNEYDVDGYGENMYVESDLHWIHYLNSDAKVKVYFGIGPYVRFSHSRSDEYGENDFVTYLRNENTYYVGLSGAFGLEYFILDNISLIGEYYINGNYYKTVGYRYEYYSSNNTLDYKSFGWNYGINRMRIGFSVYF